MTSSPSSGLAAIANPALLEALAFARSRPEPVTAADLAAATAVHRNVAAARLDALAAAGVLSTSYARRSGRSGPGAGRPAKLYSVMPELDAIAYPQRRFERLVGRLLDELPVRDRHRRLRVVGEDFGRELAAATGLRRMRSRRAGLERLCLAAGAAGFQTTLLEQSGSTAVLTTPTCPLRPLVACQPEAAEIDRGMWAALAEASVAGTSAPEIACQTEACGDGRYPCRIEIRFGP